MKRTSLTGNLKPSVHDAENSWLQRQMIFDDRGTADGPCELIELHQHHGAAAVVCVITVSGTDHVVLKHRHGVVVQFTFELQRRHLNIALNCI